MAEPIRRRGFAAKLVPASSSAADGWSFDADLVHRLGVANLHGEFCTALASLQAVGLLAAANPDPRRVQGNELHRGVTRKRIVA